MRIHEPIALPYGIAKVGLSDSQFQARHCLTDADTC